VFSDPYASQTFADISPRKLSSYQRGEMGGNEVD